MGAPTGGARPDTLLLYSNRYSTAVEARDQENAVDLGWLVALRLMNPSHKDYVPFITQYGNATWKQPDYCSSEEVTSTLEMSVATQHFISLQNMELVTMLLHQGAQVDYRENTDDPFPRTTLCDEPLRLAIRNRHIEVAQILLEHGADPNKRYFFGAEINLVSPLDLDFLQLLLTFGANPDTRDRAGLTPLMKAARSSQGMDSVLLLLSYGADVNAMTDARHDYRTVLHYAVLSGNLSTVNLLVKQGARVDYPTDYQKPTPLDLAILKGDPELVKMLLVAGANVNSSSPIIGSALHVACADNIPNRLDILKLLLSSGADPNMVIESDEGPPLRPVLAEYISSNENPCPVVLNMLLRHGAKVVMKTQFRDPHGLLNYLQNLAQHPSLFITMLEAAESFDICMIRRSSFLTESQKQLLLQLATQPLPLRQQTRLFLRRYVGKNLPNAITPREIAVTRLISPEISQCLNMISPET
uniref:Uncharacterized protein n=1 Tax=Timema shepardi TaxID=629360 RepID=A0A7R9AMK1_TIMSH|nr:unnamed protein product [Timema shepardi]